MRIAYVCADPGIPVYGRKGASVHVQEVVRAFGRAGCEVELFATRVGGEAPADLAGVPLRRLPEGPAGTPEARARQALHANAALRSALAAAGPFDLVYERYSLWSWAGIAQARDAGCPALLEVNAPLIEEQARHRVLALPEEAERVAMRAFGGADALIAVSPGVADYLGRRPEAAGRVHVVGNGVDPARFAAAAQRVRERTLAAALAPSAAQAGQASVAARTAQEGSALAVPPPAAAPVVGFLGTLKPWHGLPVLVEAFARLVGEHGIDARLRIVGDGPEREGLVASLAARGLAGRTDLRGAVAPEAVGDELAAMDVATAPYAEAAGFYFSPLKLVEYMAAGVPVVASRVGHLGDWLRDGETACLVPPDDAGALAAALARLLRAPSERLALAEAAHAEVVRAHTWDTVAQRLLALARAPRRPAGPRDAAAAPVAPAVVGAAPVGAPARGPRPVPSPTAAQALERSR